MFRCLGVGGVDGGGGLKVSKKMMAGVAGGREGV